MEIVNLKSPFDELKLETAVFVPKNTPKAIIQFSHGMSEHKERYFDFINYLSDNGYVCVINDHRGHGASVREKSDYGYFYTDDESAIVEDLHTVTEYIKNRFPDIPLFIFSHSMGTLVVRNYMKKYDDEILKVVLCGPPTENSSVNLGLRLAKISGHFHKEKAPNHMLNNATFNGYNGKSDVPNSWISNNKQNVEKYNNDKKCGFVFTTNGFVNLFKLQKEAFNKQNWNPHNKSLPVFVIAGKDDPVIQSEKKFDKLIKFLKEVGYTNVSEKLYENKRHEILNETDNAEVYADVLSFFES